MPVVECKYCGYMLVGQATGANKTTYNYSGYFESCKVILKEPKDSKNREVAMKMECPYLVAAMQIAK